MSSYTTKDGKKVEAIFIHKDNDPTNHSPENIEMGVKITWVLPYAKAVSFLKDSQNPLKKIVQKPKKHKKKVTRVPGVLENAPNYFKHSGSINVNSTPPKYLEGGYHSLSPSEKKLVKKYICRLGWFMTFEQVGKIVGLSSKNVRDVFYNSQRGLPPKISRWNLKDRKKAAPKCLVWKG